ncbi:hypothetical protein E4U30_002606 [Claviceps sp. LM220 group G6]|nr:hypothetical protein E4U30_002606 [Claviceps sp. LM220 group G6]
MTTPASDPMYVLQDIPRKSKGLVATRNILKGTRILCEEPLFTIPIVPDFQRERFGLIHRQVASLSDDQRNAFLSMHNIYPPRDPIEGYVGIFETNSLPASAGGSQTAQTRGIYLEACRLNHDCQGNAVYSWNPRIERITVHAIRDINAGEEITVPYVEFLKPRESRQSALKDSFHFTCRCSLCSLPDEQNQERDRKIAQTVRLGELYLDDFAFYPLRALGYVDAQTRLLNELYQEGSGFPFSYQFATPMAFIRGDLARARIFAQRALSSFVTIQGSDGEEPIEYADMIKNPEDHSKRYPYPKDWKTSVDDVPKGLEPEEFENWLWKREARKLTTAPAQPMSPRSQSLFSGFADLAYKNDMDAAGSFQSRHSCFLGEIVETLVPHPLDLKIRDIHGKTVELHFYTEDEGTELVPSQYQKGHTVAVLNASQYVFKYGPRGIRHTDPKMMKIFPISLAKMLELNDQVQKFSFPQQNGTSVCHGCGKNAAASSMRRCGKCLSFWYCTKECQMAGWTSKAHKGDCNFLRDPDLRGLFLIKWNEIQECVQFPLPVADDSI